MHNPCVVSIAGTDPSGGAGIQADIKAISATGGYAASVITALVAQNTQGVQAIQEIPPKFVEQQLRSVFDDLPISAVKIGMLHDQNIIDVVITLLRQYQPPHIVMDPVLVAKSGHALFNQTHINHLTKLFPLASLITPNILEAETIIEMKITNAEEQMMAAKQLSQHFKVNVLLKGGHIPGKTSLDVLYSHDHGVYHRYESERIDSHNTHGTGCSLSSAIASFLAQNHPLEAAIQYAKNYLTKAIAASRDWKLGQGAGPINHFYFLEKNHVI